MRSYRSTLRIAGAVAVAAVVGAFSLETHGAGLSRPNQVGARPVGLGGAYVAVADDSTAVFHNPAGLAAILGGDAMVDLELIWLYQRFTPPGLPTEHTLNVPQPSPMGTVGGRIRVGAHSHMGLGFGLFNSTGGAVEYAHRSELSEGMVKTRMGMFEFVPALAYEIDKRVLVGLSLRIGLGYFSALQHCGDPFTCLSRLPPRYVVRIDTMYGVGFGYALGIRVEPFKNFTVGVVYRSNISIKMKVNKGLHALDQDITASLRLPFPQSLLVGVAYRFNPRWLLSAQFDWVDNSIFQKTQVHLSGYDPTQVPTDLVSLLMYWRDSFAVHLGVEYRPIKRFAVRGGMVFDSQAVTNRYRLREIEDTHKLGFDAGCSVYLGRWRIESAFHALAGPVNNGFKSQTFPDDYTAPGTHHPHATFALHIGGGVTF